MGKKFKNTREAKMALEKAGWYVIGGSKHLKMGHNDFDEILTFPKNHRYISAKVENTVLKVIEMTGKKNKR